MSKLERAYLVQGNEKFESIVAVEFTIKKAMSMPKPAGCNEWDIFLDMDNVFSLIKAWKKNPYFSLYIEYSAKDEKGNPLTETIAGDMRIIDIVPSSNGPNSVKGVSDALKMSSKQKFVREKVQFT